MKKRVFIITILCCFPLVLLAQSKFSASVYIQPAFNLFHIVESEAPRVVVEQTQIGYGNAIGLQLHYQISNWMFLRSGLQYRNMRYMQRLKGIVFQSNFVNNTQSHIRSSINLTTMAIPLEMEFKFPSKHSNINYIVGMGNTTHILISSHTEVSFGNLSTEPSFSFKNTNVQPTSVALGWFGGVEFVLTKNMFIALEPCLKVHINRFNLFITNSEAISTLEPGLTLRWRM